MVARKSPLEKTAQKSSPSKSAVSRRPVGEIGLGGVTYRIDRGNEEAVLLAPILDPERSRKLVRAITPSQFQIPEHATIWNLFREQLNRGILYDHVHALRTVSSLSDATEIRKALNGLRASAGNLSWADARIPERIKTLSEDGIRRRVLEGPLSDIVRGVVDPRTNLSSIQTHSRRLQEALKGGSNAIVSPTAAVTGYMADLQRRIDRDGQIYGTGEAGFDECLGIGFAPGDTHLITGETGEGKSAVALNLARMFAKTDKRVAYMCWEEKYSRVLDKIVSAETGIEFTRIVRGSITPQERVRVEQAVDFFVSGPQPRIVFVENPFLGLWLNPKRDRSGRIIKITQQDVMETIRNILADASVDVVIYDMWERSVQESGLHAIEKSLEATQNIHKEFDVCGILIVQMNIDKIRNQRTKKDASSIKGSKRAPEISDLVMILDRPSLRGEFIPGPDGKDKLFMRLDKQRVLPDGSSGPETIEWCWEGRFQRISNAQRVIDQPAGSIDGLSMLGADGIPTNADGSEDF